MAPSSFHMLTFSLRNPYTLSLDSDSPFRALYRLLSVCSPSVHTLNLSKYSGCNILITGATSGCGFELALALGRTGCHLVLTSRNRERGEYVKHLILEEARSSEVVTSIDILDLDMTSFQSIRSAAAKVEEHIAHLDIVILNAGVYNPDFRICPESGWEETTQVNVLATSALSLLLRHHLARSERGKLLVVSSEAHAWAQPHNDKTKHLLLDMSRSDCKLYPCYQRYHISKLLNVLWVRGISSRDEWAGIDVAAVSPGFTRSGLFRTFNKAVIARALELAVCRTAAQGASQYVFALEKLTRDQGNGGFWSDGTWRKPCTAATCESGRKLQSNVYADVIDILNEPNAIGKDVGA